MQNSKYNFKTNSICSQNEKHAYLFNSFSFLKKKLNQDDHISNYTCLLVN